MDSKIKTLLILLLIINISGCTGIWEEEKRQLHELSKSSRRGGQLSKAECDKAARIYVDLSLGYLKAGDTVRAHKKLIRAQELNNNLVEVQSAAGYYWEKVGEFERAEKAYKTAVKLGNKKGSVTNNYAAFLCRRGDFKSAEHFFKLAISDPNYSNTGQVLENAGLCALSAGDAVKARHYLETAILHDDRCEQAWIELAEIYAKSGEWQKVAECVSKNEKLAGVSARSSVLKQRLAQQDNKNSILR